MSIQLSHGESVVRKYNYAKIKKAANNSEESLIITNKRIIQRTESTGAGSKSITNSEMPLESAAYVNVSYGLTRGNPFMFIVSIISLFIGLFVMGS